MLSAGRFPSTSYRFASSWQYSKYSLNKKFLSTIESKSNQNITNIDTENYTFKKSKRLFESRSSKDEIIIMSVLQRRYHPAITRSYIKSLQYLNNSQISKNNQITAIKRMSEPFQVLTGWSNKVLLALSRHGSKHMLRPILECYLAKVNTGRRNGGDLVMGMLPSINIRSSTSSSLSSSSVPSKTLPSASTSSQPIESNAVLSKHEMLLLISTLRILSPRSIEIWQEVDRLLCIYVDKSSSTFDPEIALLLSHTLVSGLYENKLKGVEIQSINKMFTGRLEELLAYLTSLGRNSIPDTIVSTSIDPSTAAQVFSNSMSNSNTSINSNINSNLNTSEGPVQASPNNLPPPSDPSKYAFMNISTKSTSSSNTARQSLMGVTDSVFDSVASEQFGLFLEALTFCTDPEITSKGSLNTIYNRLYMTFLTIVSQTTAQMKESNSTTNRPTFITTVTKPLKLSCLVSIAKQLAKLKVPNSVHYELLNKTLYQHIMSSVQADSYQLLNEEIMTVEILESMVASDSKNHHELIRFICDFYREKGMDIDRIGSRLFNVLCVLEAFSYALYMLDLIIESSCLRVDIVPYAFNMEKNISMMAKARIYHYLKDRKLPAGHPNALSNLILSLHCFYSDSKLYSLHRFQSNKTYIRFLDESESVVHKNFSHYSIDQLLKLHKSYASVGRRHPDMCRELDYIFSRNYHVFSDAQLASLLWSNARLNISTSYNRIIGKSYLFKVLEKTPTSYHAIDEAARTVWAMAVLQILQPEEFLLIEPILLSSSFLHSSVRSESHPIQIQRIKQILLEMRLCLFTRKSNPTSNQISTINSEQNIEESEHPLENNKELPMSMIALELKNIHDNVMNDSDVSIDSSREREKNDIVYSKIMAPRHWENTTSMQPTKSSYSHREICKVLTFMGIQHEVEKPLEFGLVVDIFIPPSQAALLAYQRYEDERNQGAKSSIDTSTSTTHNSNNSDVNGSVKSDKGHKGIVLEVDGPFHFESYLMVSVV